MRIFRFFGIFSSSCGTYGVSIPTNSTMGSSNLTLFFTIFNFCAIWRHPIFGSRLRDTQKYPKSLSKVHEIMLKSKNASSKHCSEWPKKSKCAKKRGGAESAPPGWVKEHNSTPGLDRVKANRHYSPFFMDTLYTFYAIKY